MTETRRSRGTGFVDALRNPAFWRTLLDRSEERLLRDERWTPESASPERHCSLNRRERVAAFRELVESGEMLGVAEAVARKDYRPSPPVHVLINKGRTAKKRTIYVFSPRDDLLFKATNKYLQHSASADVSASCHSFQRGKGLRTAFQDLLSDREIGAKACIRLDVADYFNSIDPDILLRSLPDTIASDGRLMYLLGCILHTPEAIREGRTVTRETKGVMPGSALSCMLSNFYLRDLDEHFRVAGITYARYSDDIILFADPNDADRQERVIRTHLASKALSVNERKSQVVAPGEVWEYLGLRYHDGTIDLSEEAKRKFEGKVRRLARVYAKSQLSPEAAAAAFLGEINQKCYGVGIERGQFTWAIWFFPLLSSTETLKALDRFVQEKVRSAATRRRGASAHKLLPYSSLQGAGYLPLTAAHYAFKRSPEEYETLLRRRTGAGRWPQSVTDVKEWLDGHNESLDERTLTVSG